MLDIDPAVYKPAPEIIPVFQQEVDMKKFTIFFSWFCLVVFSAGSVLAQGFTGPSAGTAAGRVQKITVIQAGGLPDESLVTLTGNIVQSLGREKYTFRDSTGDITVEIDRELWTLLGISVGAADLVEIGGEIDAEERRLEIDVKYIKKI